jgi:hypothetical protein
MPSIVSALPVSPEDVEANAAKVGSEQFLLIRR